MDQTQKPKPLSKDYKKKLAECLVKYQNYTIDRAYQAIADYENDLPGYLNEGLSPKANACIIAMNF